MYLDLISIQKSLYSGEIELIQLPGTDGSFELLQDHSPLVATLKQGTIKIKEQNGNILYFEVNSGLVEIVNNNIKVLVD